MKTGIASVVQDAVYVVHPARNENLPIHERRDALRFPALRGLHVLVSVTSQRAGTGLDRINAATHVNTKS